MHPKITFDALSVTAYIMRELDAKPGISSAELIKNRPSHIARTSIPPRLLELTALKVVRRSPVTSDNNRSTFAYWIADESRLPPNWRQRPFSTRLSQAAQGRGRGRGSGASKPATVERAADVKPADVKPAMKEAPISGVVEPASTEPRIVVFVEGRRLAFSIPQAKGLYSQLALVFA